MSNITESNRGPGRPGNAMKSAVEIKLNQHFTSRVYTSGSTVSGSAVVKCARDTPFDGFDIYFTGVAATRLDFVQSYTTNAVRTFMKLQMPIEEEHVPENRVFKAGETYSVPFTFVVPHHLTMGACNHECPAPAVQDQHLKLPPTLGYWDGDDQAPDMTHVEYAIKAKVRGAPRTNQPLEGKKILKVLPATEEEPPLDITFRDERYCLSKTKTFRKNLLGAKSGELTATASQPQAIMVHADGFGAHGTNAKVNLEFAPAAADAAPPKINSITGKLISTTFFGSAPSDALPNLGPKTTYSHNQVLTYSATTNLFSNKVDKLNWSEHNVTMPRRDSGSSASESPISSSDEGRRGSGSGSGSDSTSKKSKSLPIRHRTSLEVPFSVPVSNKRTFVPTFHNCIMSRTYVLQLVLSVGPGNTTMTLSVPLQLGVEKIFDEEELPSFETALAQREADGFAPRMDRRDESPQRGGLPGYDDLNHGSRSVAVA